MRSGLNRKCSNPGGRLDTEQDCKTLLSLREQQLLVFAHILLAGPRFVFLDRINTTLKPVQIHKIPHMLSGSSIAHLITAMPTARTDLYDAALESAEDGSWKWTLNRA